MSRNNQLWTKTHWSVGSMAAGRRGQICLCLRGFWTSNSSLKYKQIWREALRQAAFHGYGLFEEWASAAICLDRQTLLLLSFQERLLIALTSVGRDRGICWHHQGGAWASGDLSGFDVSSCGSEMVHGLKKGCHSVLSLGFDVFLSDRSCKGWSTVDSFDSVLTQMAFIYLFAEWRQHVIFSLFHSY